MGPKTLLAASVDMYDPPAAGLVTAAAPGAALATAAAPHQCIRYSEPLSSALLVLKLTFASPDAAAAVRSMRVHM